VNQGRGAFHAFRVRQGHPEAFFRGWREVVGPEDLVIVAGDISWAMRLAEAIPDLLDLASLPGRKVLLKGNHDYWWPSISRLRAVLPEGMYALQNDALGLSLKALKGQPYRHLVLAFHFPPFGPGEEASPLLEMAAEAGPSAIVYGHLHGADPERLPQAYRGIPLHLVAADALGFRPKMILEED
jgi:predicted phosphohydrolase